MEAIQNINETITNYENLLKKLKVELKEFMETETLQNPDDGLSYALSLLAKARKFTSRGKFDEATALLCFIQGILWTNGQIKGNLEINYPEEV